MFYHPNYYKELAKEKKKLEEKLKRQATSDKQEGSRNDNEEQAAGKTDTKDPQ